MTAKQIDNLSIEELEQLAEGLTKEENELWAYWGYEGRTYELIMRNRTFVKSAKEHWYNIDMNPANKLNALMNRVNQLEDLYETAKAEDDRWTMNTALLELDEINKTLDELENEHWYNFNIASITTTTQNEPQ